MSDKNKKPPIFASIEDVSVLRKFAILFLLCSIVPMTLLYFNYVKGSKVGIMVMVLAVIGVLVGFLTIRNLLINAIGVARDNRKAIESYLSPDAVEELRQGQNEIVALNRTFSAVTRQLEANISELKKKNEELRALDQLKDDFVNNVSHEFRLPLTIIQESIRQISEGLVGTVNEEQKQYLEMSLRNIDRLKSLIDNMLDIAKIEKGRLELFKKNVDIRTVIQEVASDFSQKIKANGLDMVLDLPAQHLEVWADRDKITQVLVNLIGNACKFTEQGEIKIAARENGDLVECSVKDSGIGIAAQDIPLLFSKYHQLGRLNDAQRGTGLGLFISKQIIELHNGTFDVESEKGLGTRFIFTLPKATASPMNKEGKLK